MEKKDKLFRERLSTNGKNREKPRRRYDSWRMFASSAVIVRADLSRRRPLSSRPVLGWYIGRTKISFYYTIPSNTTPPNPLATTPPILPTAIESPGPAVRYQSNSLQRRPENLTGVFFLYFFVFSTRICGLSIRLRRRSYPWPSVSKFPTTGTTVPMTQNNITAPTDPKRDDLTVMWTKGC